LVAWPAALKTVTGYTEAEIDYIQFDFSKR